MDFPEQLDPDEMDLAKKEWKLSGLDVVDADWKDITQVIVGKRRPKDHLLNWYWFTRYDLEDGVWMLKIKEEHHYSGFDDKER